MLEPMMTNTYTVYEVVDYGQGFIPERTPVLITKNRNEALAKAKEINDNIKSIAYAEVIREYYGIKTERIF